ncbi:MAG TPA: HD domain-containing phosphohydrolase [Dehalococcoidales bacterium]|nr:HD domain-containing phosphohydrolase [Dehalococcoidales bacterium]
MVYSPGKSQPATALPGRVERENKARLELIYEVSKKVGSVPRMTEMLEQVIKMTQQTLNASAASILLFRNNDQELYFEVASGPVGKALRQVKLSTQYGIAGQVARTGKPLIVNDVRRSENFHKMIDDTTGFSTKSLVCAPLSVHHKILGVIEVLNKRDGSEFEEQDLEAVVSVANTSAMAIENTRLHQTVLDAYKNTIKTLAAAIDAKDPYTRGHSQRVMEYTLLAGAYLSFTAEEMETLEYAGILHDIGKISVDSTVLNKPGSLSESEWEIIREHPTIGANLLREIPFLEKASELVHYHHEKYDGRGYPNGLEGEAIPLGARLIAVADAFDTMTTDRSYRAALTVDHAVKELHDCSGSQFCPVAVKAFIAGLRLNTGK